MFEESSRFRTIDSILSEAREYDPGVTLAELARFFEQFMSPQRLKRLLDRADTDFDAQECVRSLFKTIRRQLSGEADIVARSVNGWSNSLRSRAVHHFDPLGPYLPTVQTLET